MYVFCLGDDEFDRCSPGRGRAQRAGAGLDVELGAVRGAHDAVAVGVQVSVLAPGHRRAAMVRDRRRASQTRARRGAPAARVSWPSPGIEAARFAIRQVIEAAQEYVSIGAVP
jgi:hypothetical protein